ncbi:MAG: LruC domain-containing protein [Muribaculaceae bacterium]|nr:LruC domain-containing protein [Muribaculaceae bacterium]
MKKTLTLLLLPWAVALAACSADEPQTISATEDYNRGFVKEFGVPARGHDFSMATTAGLKVTSRNGDHITVTAEIDGEEYLFADCHVPAGTTAIPVTIPRSVSELKLSTTRGESSVSTNAVVNLDEIEPGIMRVAASPSPEGNPYIAFKTKDLLKPFLEKDKSKFSATSPAFPNRGKSGYIFPIYWKWDKNKNRDYRVQFVTSKFGANDGTLLAKDVIFDEKQSKTSPFPAIKYSPYISNIEDIEPDSYFSGGEFSNYSYNAKDDIIVVSRGIRINDYLEEDRPPLQYSWYLEVDYGYDAEGNCSVSSESPYRNVAFWNGNYYDMPLKHLKYAHHGAFMFLAEPSEFYIYDTLSSDGTPAGYFRKISCKAYIIGFNTAPASAGADDDRDWCDVAFLYLKPGYASSGTVSTSTQYKWRIAAEDLGATDDWDFNDAVFEFSDQIRDLNTVNTERDAWQIGPRDAQPVRVISVTPQAAGGTMPLYITYTGKVGAVPEIPDGKGQTADIMYSEANQVLKDHMNNLAYNEGTFIVGEELHSWLGADSHTTIFNTEATKKYPKATSVEFVIPMDAQPTLEPGDIWNSQTQTSSTGTLMASTANKTICGFAVVVDRNNTLNIDAMDSPAPGIHSARDLVLGSGAYVIGRPDATNGEIAPQMLLVNGSWRWPQERVKISDAYPDFSAWLSNPASAPAWTKNYIKEKVTY